MSGANVHGLPETRRRHTVVDVAVLVVVGKVYIADSGKCLVAVVVYKRVAALN